MTKDKFTSILLSILITAIVGILLSFIFFPTKKTQTKIEPNAEQGDPGVKQEIPISNTDNKNLTCHENAKYFVIVEKLSNEVGSNFLIKYKNNENQKLLCAYNLEQNDFELRNLDGADYFFGLENNFLVLDNGTGNIRSLIVYDLAKQEKVFKDIYFGVTDMNESQITYWARSAVKPGKSNCPLLDKYLADGGRAEIQKKVLLDLIKLNTKDLKETRCAYVE